MNGYRNEQEKRAALLHAQVEAECGDDVEIEVMLAVEEAIVAKDGFVPSYISSPGVVRETAELVTDAIAECIKYPECMEELIEVLNTEAGKKLKTLIAKRWASLCAESIQEARDAAEAARSDE